MGLRIIFAFRNRIKYIAYNIATAILVVILLLERKTEENIWTSSDYYQ